MKNHIDYTNSETLAICNKYTRLYNEQDGLYNFYYLSNHSIEIMEEYKLSLLEASIYNYISRLPIKIETEAVVNTFYSHPESQNYNDVSKALNKLTKKGLFVKTNEREYEDRRSTNYYQHKGNKNVRNVEYFENVNVVNYIFKNFIDKNLNIELCVDTPKKYILNINEKILSDNVYSVKFSKGYKCSVKFNDGTIESGYKFHTISICDKYWRTCIVIKKGSILLHILVESFQIPHIQSKGIVLSEKVEPHEIVPQKKHIPKLDESYIKYEILKNQNLSGFDIIDTSYQSFGNISSKTIKNALSDETITIYDNYECGVSRRWCTFKESLIEIMKFDGFRDGWN